MKIDRIVGVLNYLLAHGIVPARTLAQHFEVSIRTIQRDIDVLGRAGYPVYSVQGPSGGYGLVEEYKIDKQLMSEEELRSAAAALRAVTTAVDDVHSDRALTKIGALTGADRRNSNGSALTFDLGVYREGPFTGSYIRALEEAIRKHRVVRFEYTDASNRKSLRETEPITLLCKWYRWYLFAFCLQRRDYRLFRLSRIRNLHVSAESATVHADAESLLQSHTAKNRSDLLEVRLECGPESRVLLEDYFPNASVSLTRGGACVFECTLPADERGWIGILMTFGGAVKVLAPESLRLRIADTAREILEGST